MNAFQMVRPRGADTAPANAPRKTNHSKAPMDGNAHLPLDSNGRRTVSLERKTKGGITNETREQSAASLAKTQRIKGRSERPNRRRPLLAAQRRNEYR